MKKNKFYIILTILAFIVTVIIVLIQYSDNNKLINPYIWYIQGYLFVVSLLTYYFSSKGIKDNLMDFQNYVMGSIGIRFFLSAIIIFLYIYYVKTESFSFLVNFFILYLLYTGFEIKSLLSNLRAHLDNENR